MEKPKWKRGAAAIFVIAGLILFAFVIFMAGAAYGGTNLVSPSSNYYGGNPFGVILFIGIELIMLIFLTRMVFGMVFFPHRGWGMHRKHMHGWRNMRWNPATPPQFFFDWHEHAHDGGDRAERQEPDS